MTSSDRLRGMSASRARKSRAMLHRIGWAPSEAKREKGIEIDAEFQALIPPLSTDEHAALESSLLSEGCRDALVVWPHDGVLTLIDGHNRYGLCEKHQIEFEVVEREFESREDVIVWMVRNQLARRNLTDAIKIELALKGEEAIAKKAKSNQGTRNDILLNSTKSSPINTRAEIAAIAGTSEDSVRKMKNILKNAPDSIKEKVRNDEITINRGEEITKAYTRASDPVKAAVQQHGIIDPQLITLLETKKATDTVQSLLSSGVIQTDADADTKPLSEATAWDVQGVLRKAEKEHRRAAADSRLEAKHAQIQTAPDGVYSVIYADPPWQYDNSGLYGAAATIYPTMPIEDICAYFERINVHAQEDAVLFLWATNPLLQEALAVMTAWGFDYKTNIVWDKEQPTTGLGFYVKGQHELLLIGTRGSFRPNYMPSSVIRDRKGDHSRKPLSLYSLIETMYPKQRYLELFARAAEERDDWTFFGGEA